MVQYITPLMTPKYKTCDRFTTIALPNELVKQIDDFVAENKPIYLNRPHVIKIALEKFWKNNGGNTDGSSNSS